MAYVADRSRAEDSAMQGKLSRFTITLSCEVKPAPDDDSSKEVLTPRSQSCSTCESIYDCNVEPCNVDEGTGIKGAPESSSDSCSPRSQLCGPCASDDLKTFVDGANTGDGFDSRWLLEMGSEERVASSFSGDGTLENVGRNISGTHPCSICVQQFGCEKALNLHMKFAHQEVEQVGEWLPFPSA
jgi:hypothetical protein